MTDVTIDEFMGNLDTLVDTNENIAPDLRPSTISLSNDDEDHLSEEEIIQELQLNVKDNTIQDEHEQYEFRRTILTLDTTEDVIESFDVPIDEHYDSYDDPDPEDTGRESCLLPVIEPHIQESDTSNNERSRSFTSDITLEDDIVNELPSPPMDPKFRSFYFGAKAMSKWENKNFPTDRHSEYHGRLDPSELIKPHRLSFENQQRFSTSDLAGAPVFCDIKYFLPNFGRDIFLEQLSDAADASQAIANAKKKASMSNNIQNGYNTKEEVDSKTKNLGEIIREGYLKKRARLVKSTWHKRYFILRKTPRGVILSYCNHKPDTSSSNAAKEKKIDLVSTSRCVVLPPSTATKPNEFRILSSADSSSSEFAMSANSNYEMTEWVQAIRSAIATDRKCMSLYRKTSTEMQLDIEYDDLCGSENNDPVDFLLYFGIRVTNSLNLLKARVLEINFADETIVNARRGETLDTFYFSELRSVRRPSPRSPASARSKNRPFRSFQTDTQYHFSQSMSSATALRSPTSADDDCRLILVFTGYNRVWSVVCETPYACNELFNILQRIINKKVVASDLIKRSPKLTLKRGVLERRNGGAFATLRGKLYVVLYDNQVVFYPEEGDVKSRPWYVLPLLKLSVSAKIESRQLFIGHLGLICSSKEECQEWFGAVSAALVLPDSVVKDELLIRKHISLAYYATIHRLRKLLKADVKPEVNGPPKHERQILILMKALWKRVFPNLPFTDNRDERWLELGFQRGGPKSDLRASGLLGLYCIIYFCEFESKEFQRILERTRHGVSQGNLKTYPFAIACINIVLTLVVMLGLADAGVHAQGCSANARITYIHLISQTGTVRAATYDPKSSEMLGAMISGGKEIGTFESWEDFVNESSNHVFESIFCILFPILDRLFLAMDAGYMEFGQVVEAFRSQVRTIFDAQPKSLDELRQFARDSSTDEYK